ncbi:methyltransferase domain-containing protein [Streptomyces sp. G45]|uniref:methyltransferase domain-containing protein n=1 Tax=Streptomyces sp. G45 TaxID=3406627 RepID=UPI003C15609E
MTRETGPVSPQTDDLAARLDAADQLTGAARLRLRTYDLLRAGPGATVVDVGCGTGRAVGELARRGVTAIGVDMSASMIATARARCPEADFRVAGAYALPLEDGTVDGCRADKLFHELAEPARAVAEARRVLAPGGRIVLVGQDWDAFVIDSADPALTRALVHARADRITAPRAARQYRALLLDGGFAEVTAEAHTGVFTEPSALPLLTGLAEAARASGAVTHGQADRWIADQRARAEANRLFLALPVFVAAATAP